ncbi:MAG: DNA translocase FtsK 4TM domain-containing protein, partial [Magnetococcales bacterium]|nr:DNA translocase FtsK 4TM domain-containing protein [Magnetococcales bacterium]
MASPKNEFIHKRKLAKEKRDSLLREVLGVLLIGVDAFLIVSLATYHREDPSFNNTGSELVHNLAGLSGAFFADVMYQILGLAAVWVPLVVASMSIRLLYKRLSPLLLEQLISLPMLSLVTAVFSTLLVPPETAAWLPAGPGGVVGFFGAGSLGKTLGVPISLILLGALGVVSLFIFTHFSPGRFFAFLGGRDTDKSGRYDGNKHVKHPPLSEASNKHHDEPDLAWQSQPEMAKHRQSEDVGLHLPEVPPPPPIRIAEVWERRPDPDRNRPSENDREQRPAVTGSRLPESVEREILAVVLEDRFPAVTERPAPGMAREPQPETERERPSDKIAKSPASEVDRKPEPETTIREKPPEATREPSHSPITEEPFREPELIAEPDPLLHPHPAAKGAIEPELDAPSPPATTEPPRSEGSEDVWFEPAQEGRFGEAAPAIVAPVPTPPPTPGAVRRALGTLGSGVRSAAVGTGSLVASGAVGGFGLLRKATQKGVAGGADLLGKAKEKGAGAVSRMRSHSLSDWRGLFRGRGAKPVPVPGADPTPGANLPGQADHLTGGDRIEPEIDPGATASLTPTALENPALAPNTTATPSTDPHAAVAPVDPLPSPVARRSTLSAPAPFSLPVPSSANSTPGAADHAVTSSGLVVGVAPTDVPESTPAVGAFASSSTDLSQGSDFASNPPVSQTPPPGVVSPAMAFTFAPVAEPLSPIAAAIAPTPQPVEKPVTPTLPPRELSVGPWGVRPMPAPTSTPLPTTTKGPKAAAEKGHSPEAGGDPPPWVSRVLARSRPETTPTPTHQSAAAPTTGVYFSSKLEETLPTMPPVLPGDEDASPLAGSSPFRSRHRRSLGAAADEGDDAPALHARENRPPTKPIILEVKPPGEPRPAMTPAGAEPEPRLSPAPQSTTDSGDAPEESSALSIEALMVARERREEEKKVEITHSPADDTATDPPPVKSGAEGNGVSSEGPVAPALRFEEPDTPGPEFGTERNHDSEGEHAPPAQWAGTPVHPDPAKDPWADTPAHPDPAGEGKGVASDTDPSPDPAADSPPEPTATDVIAEAVDHAHAPWMHDVRPAPPLPTP